MKKSVGLLAATLPKLHNTVVEFGFFVQNEADAGAAMNDAVDGVTLPLGVTSVRSTLSVPLVSVEPALFWTLTW
jgi:hypothetical protein